LEQLARFPKKTLDISFRTSHTVAGMKDRGIRELPRSFVVSQKEWLISLSWTSPRKSYVFNGSNAQISRRRLGILDCAPLSHQACRKDS
jgi:hypothetical protein